MNKKRPIAADAPSGPIATDPIDDRHLLLSRLRQAEELIRTARVRVQSAYEKQGAEALYELKSANMLVEQVVKDLIAHGIEEGDFMFGERSHLS